MLKPLARARGVARYVKPHYVRCIMSKQIMSKAVRAYLAQIGQRGGEAGKGRAKRRGDASHYRALSAQRWKAARERGGIP